MSAVDRRVQDLDTIAAVLPMERRDELAELLTDQDVETLRHLVNEGMGDNTLRALTSDLAYLQAWSLAATGRSLPWPASEALLLKFVAHHLWDAEKRFQDPDHGMPADVEQKLRIQGLLRSPGPHAPDTVRRRLATWSTLTKWRGLNGFFGSPALKSAIRLAVRATPRPRRRKSAKAVTGDILSRLIATCSTGSLRDIRDRAILMVAFASGGRRRSEIAGLRIEQLQQEEPIQIDGAPPCSLFPFILVAPRPAAPTTTVSRRPLDPKAINDILKQRAELAGLDPAEFSAHGLRSGYLTEAAHRGIPLPEAMEQSRHRSVQQASDYYNSSQAERKGGAASLG